MFFCGINRWSLRFFSQEFFLNNTFNFRRCWFNFIFHFFNFPVNVVRIANFSKFNFGDIFFLAVE